MSGYKCVWAQTCLGTIVWAQACTDTNVCSPLRMIPPLHAMGQIHGALWSNFNGVKHTAEEGLVRIKDWFIRNRLPPNVNKSSFVIFTNKFVPHNFTLHISNDVITMVNSSNRPGSRSVTPGPFLVIIIPVPVIFRNKPGLTGTIFTKVLVVKDCKYLF